MMIKNLGLKVETAWKSLRPVTKEMLVRSLKPEGKKTSRKNRASYDAHSDWEISRLLDALDKQTVDARKEKADLDIDEMNNLAEACANVLQEKTESAEIFIQLANRALARSDYAKIDKLSDALLERFSASEIGEVIRQTEAPQIRAIAYETLAVMQTSSIEPLLKDPLYFEIACNVLEQQMVEFENEDARRVLERMSPGFDF